MLRGSIAPHPVAVGSKDERRARPHLRWCEAHPGTAQAGLLGMTCAGNAPGYPQRKLARMEGIRREATIQRPLDRSLFPEPQAG